MRRVVIAAFQPPEYRVSNNRPRGPHQGSVSGAHIWYPGDKPPANPVAADVVPLTN